MSEKEGEIELLGQRLSYPKTIYGAVFSLGLFTLLGFSLYTVLVLAKTENLGIMSESIIVGGFGGNKDFTISNIIQHQFWTPSEKTIKYEDLHPWVEAASANAADLNNEFGEILTSNDSIFGYRRYEVYGKGRGNGIEGFWWVLNSSPTFTTKDLASIYQDFWKTDSSIYIESYVHNSEFE
ncbi:MAG: hypothetical protein COA99_09775 [Moraxellaceae bacterium]|nr:MAG: hypothetical protein COA99_09775 [Moraxellaceae bacterium]